MRSMRLTSRGFANSAIGKWRTPSELERCDFERQGNRRHGLQQAGDSVGSRCNNHVGLADPRLTDSHRIRRAHQRAASSSSVVFVIVIRRCPQSPFPVNEDRGVLEYVAGVRPAESAAVYTNGLKAEPGCRRDRTALLKAPRAHDSDRDHSNVARSRIRATMAPCTAPSSGRPRPATSPSHRSITSALRCTVN
jgi:hypothetical protein